DALVIAPGEITGAGPLDLDHAGAEISQLARAERRRNGMFEAHHGDTVERAGFGGCVVHVRFLLFRSASVSRHKPVRAQPMRLVSRVGCAPRTDGLLRSCGARSAPYDQHISCKSFSSRSRHTCSIRTPASSALRAPENCTRRWNLSSSSARLSVLPGSPLGSSIAPCSVRPSLIFTSTRPSQRAG